jgi:hypothetical protein
MPKKKLPCECSDPGCPVCSGDCSNVGTALVFRIDMEDETGTVVCDGCSDDCLESGLFRPGDIGELIRGGVQ